MAVQIILKNSTTEDKRPKTLANGEISLNYHADGAFLCCQDTEGNIQQVGGVKISTDAPDAPVKQTLWFNPDTLTLFIFDGDAWFPVGGAGGGGGGGDIIQIIGNDGIDADTIGGIVTLDVELAGGDDGLEFKTSKLSASIASETVLGSVKIGDNIDVSADGTISVDVPQTTTFRGSCILENPPLGQLAPNPPETGDAYINGVATDSIDNGWVNLGGGASAAGDLVIWDGAEWELIQTGGDSLWQRTGTTLEPTVDGDNIATTGKITSASTEDSDSGTTVVTKDYLDTALDNIPDTDNPANQPGTLDDRYVNVIGDNMTGDLTLGTDKITLDASNGNATFAGKATSASTEDTDSDTTLVTKDYLASEIAEGIDDLDAVTEITPGDGIDTRETDGDVTVSVYLAGTNDGLEFETGKLKATVATASELGSVMIGDGVNVDADGTISVPEAPSVTTSDTPPLAADSSNGDLWWNTNDGRLYIYYTDGDSSQWVDASPDSQTELITNGPSFPTDAEVNDLFFNTTEGRLYIYFDDGNSQQWVDASPQGSTGEGGGGGGDVERLVAGDNITLSPADGKGVVTISATGGGGGTTDIYGTAKAWGNVKFDGILNENSNISSVTNSSPGTYDVVFVTPVSSTNYAVTATSSDAQSIIVSAKRQTINGFSIETYRTLESQLGNQSFSFAVHDNEPVTVSGGSGGTTVNYNGASAWGATTGVATPSLAGSYNIASVTRTGAGGYDVVFTVPMANDQYSVVIAAADDKNGKAIVGPKSSTGFTYLTVNKDSAADNFNVNFAVHSANAIAPQSGIGADAWAKLNCSNLTFEGSFNFSGASNDDAGRYIFTFTKPMPSTNYSVVATSDFDGDLNCTVRNATANQFEVRVSQPDNQLTDASSFIYVTVHASSTVTPTYTWTRDGTTLKPANDGDGVELDSYLTVADFVTSGERNKADSKGGITINGNAGTIEVYGYYNEKVLQIFDNSDNEKIALERSGSATFAGRVTADVEDNNAVVGYVRGDTSTESAFFARNFNTTDTGFNYKGLDSQGNTTFNVSADGSASFAGSITVSPNENSSVNNPSSGNGGVGFYAKGLKDSNQAGELRWFGNSTSENTLFTVNVGATVVGFAARTTTGIRIQSGVNGNMWKLDSNGAFTAKSVNGASILIQLEADDDTKYTATTNEEGEQTLVYNGATLDVKDRLQKADAALLALKEAAVAATDFASLQAAIVTALADI